MSAPAPRKIDWGTAHVEDATLVVELSGASSKAWKERFDSVLALLETAHARARWGKVRVTKNRVQVADVQPGTETELRHFLESAMMQVNSELPPLEQDATGVEDAQVDEASHADRQMTVAFRTFAEG